MVGTRSQANADPFAHVLDNVFKQGPDSPLRKSLQHEGILNMFDLIALNESDISALKYMDDSGGTPIETPLPRGYRSLLVALLGYTTHCYQNGTPLGYSDWINVTADEFNEYRLSYAFIAFRSGAISSASTMPSAPTPRPKDPVESFKRGIKRDITHFTPFKDDKQWDTWSRSTMAQARAQDVDSVLDPAYIPSSEDEKLLFDEKQKYMYAVFECTLLTDYGKSLVRQYASTFDAQAIYSSLAIYALQSTKAAISSSTLLSYITSARLGDNTWKGTTLAFILHWQEQVRRYEMLVPTTDHFSDGQ
jgi:hypothetical protein